MPSFSGSQVKPERERIYVETFSGRVTPDYSSVSRENDDEFVKGKKAERKELDKTIKEMQDDGTYSGFFSD